MSCPALCWAALILSLITTCMVSFIWLWDSNTFVDNITRVKNRLIKKKV